MVDDLVARARAFSIVYHGAPKPLINEIADRIEKLEAALKGLVAEFEKFSRYGSPIAMAANEAMQLARATLSDSSAK